MRRFVGSTLMIAFLLLACDEKPAPAPQTETPAAQPTAQPAPAATPTAAESASVPVPSAAQTPAPKPTPAPASTAKPAPAPAPAPAPGPAPQAAAPAPAATPVPAPAPSASTGAMPSLANNGHAAAGPDKCRMCHRLQHDSWSVTAHAKKGLDCEGCHGNGADYKTMSVMKDLAAAKAAGLVMPGPDFCRKCHGAKADASLLPRAHAHKAK